MAGRLAGEERRRRSSVVIAAADQHAGRDLGDADLLGELPSGARVARSKHPVHASKVRPSPDGVDEASTGSGLVILGPWTPTTAQATTTRWSSAPDRGRTGSRSAGKTSRSASWQLPSSSASWRETSSTAMRRPTWSSSPRTDSWRSPQRARPLSRSALGADLPRRRRVARLLAAQARLPQRVARPPREGGAARHRVGRALRRVHYSEPNGDRALLELAPVPSWHELQFKP